MIRMTIGQDRSPIVPITRPLMPITLCPTDARKVESTTIAPRTNGTPKKTSATRASSESTQPPANPAIRPMTEPTSTTAVVASTPTTIETRVPWTVRA